VLYKDQVSTRFSWPAKTPTMIRNGLYSFGANALDGVDGGDNGVMVLRDGTMRGGTSFFYFVGTYTCSDGKWKGEITSQEHTHALATRPMAGRVVNIGFNGTYTDMGAEVGCTALVGKRSIRYDATFLLLVAD
jgi:hypothetical protein